MGALHAECRHAWCSLFQGRGAELVAAVGWVGGESISGSHVLNVPQLGIDLLRCVCCVEGDKDPAELVQCCLMIRTWTSMLCPLLR